MQIDAPWLGSWLSYDLGGSYVILWIVVSAARPWTQVVAAGVWTALLCEAL